MTTKKPSLREHLIDFGKARQDLQIMPKLAYAVAQAAERGEVDETDATELYTTYYSHTGQAARHVEPTAPTIRVQASKLRQIIKAADTGLLDKVIEAHRQVIDRKPLYPAMVDAARLQVTSGKPLSDRRIKEIVRRPR